MCEFLKSDHFLFYDGGMGTTLIRKGLLPGQLPELWNLSHPDIVAQIHRSYLDAGSRLLCTNTFCSNRRNLKSTGHTVEEVVGAAVRIAKSEAGTQAKVGLDIGPIGEMLFPVGKFSFPEAYEMFRETAVAGEKAGADFAAIETISDLAELRAAVLAVRENTSLPILATMTFDRSGRTFLGCRPDSFAQVAEGLGVNAVGVNCSIGPSALVPIVKKMASATSLPLIAKPNAGLPDRTTGAYDLSAEDFGEEMTAFCSLGVQIVGGCCGTDPNYIAALVRRYAGLPFQKRELHPQSCACTATRCVPLNDQTKLGTSMVLGERAKFHAAVHESDPEAVIDLAESELDDGADILCMPTVHGDDRDAFLAVLTALQGQVVSPLAFAAECAEDLDAALRAFQGRACVLIRDSKERKQYMPVITKYGAVPMDWIPA